MEDEYIVYTEFATAMLHLHFEYFTIVIDAYA